MHLSAAEISLRSEDFYKQNGIEMKLGKEVSWVSFDHMTDHVIAHFKVTSVDTAAKMVMVGDEAIRYDKLLLATGSRYAPPHLES